MNAEMQNEVFLGENVGSYESYPKPLTTDEYYLEKMYRLLEARLNLDGETNAVASTNGAGGSAGLMSAADKEKLDALQPVILWSGASVANTITLNESVAGYDMVEVVGALSDSGFWSMSGKGIVNNGEVFALGLCSVKGVWEGVGLDIDGCLINISGSTLTRGSALPSNIGGGDLREIHLNATPSGSTVELTMNTGSNRAYNIRILRVIGYKAVSA